MGWVRRKPQMSIEWGITEQEQEVRMSLQGVEVGGSHTIKFESVRQNSDGSIVATVSSETLEGNTLWLKSARYGLQNGAKSLFYCSNKGTAIEGNEFVYTKSPSEQENSVVPYYHNWSKPE